MIQQYHLQNWERTEQKEQIHMQFRQRYQSQNQEAREGWVDIYMIKTETNVSHAHKYS